MIKEDIMKKIISVLLVILMLCTALLTASCSDNRGNDKDNNDNSNKNDGQKTAKEVVEGSIDKFKDLDSYYAVMTQDISVSMQGVSMEMPVTVTIKVQDAKSQNPKIYAIQEVTMLGETVSIEMYVENGYVYISSDGTNQKLELSQFGDAADSVMYNKTVEELLQVLPEDVMKDVSLLYNTNGTRYVEVEFDPTKFLQLYASNIEGLSEDLGLFIDDLQISDSKVKIVIDRNDYIKEYTLDYKMGITVQGQDANASVTLKMEFYEPGKPVTVTPMEGYQNFPSVNQ